jgi:RNA polymerase sigma-B factor
VTPRHGDDEHVDLRARSHALFDELAALPEGDPRRQDLREALVELHAGLAYSIARRFSRRGQPDDDVHQVAMLGLLKSIDRFDPSRPVEFSSFATPTIRGEIRRHFRDTAWAAHVPRGLRELAVQIPPAVEQLTSELGRSPRPSELAERLGADRSRVVEALEAADAFSAVPLDTPVREGRPMTETLGSVDAALERIDERLALRPLIEALDERERTILMLRFFEEKSQSQIAAQIGISQMHVSRLLSRTLSQLNEQLQAADAQDSPSPVRP